jgi:hypothetical protein
MEVGVGSLYFCCQAKPRLETLEWPFGDDPLTERERERLIRQYEHRVLWIADSPRAAT